MGHRFRQTFLNCAEASYFRNQRLKRFPALTRKKYESITEKQLTQLTVSNLARLLIFTGRRTENQDLYHIWFQDSNLPIHLRSLKHTSLKALGLRFNKKKIKKSRPNLLAGNVIHKGAQQCGSFSLDLSDGSARGAHRASISLRGGQSGLDLPNRSARPAPVKNPKDFRVSLGTIPGSRYDLVWDVFNANPFYIILCQYCDVWWDLMRSDESDKISFDTEAFATLLILLIVDSTTLLFCGLESLRGID